MQNGLIIENVSNLYKVKTDNCILDCVLKGRFRKSDTVPVVGDYVKIEKINGEEKGNIFEILDRKSYIKRPKIANITQILLVVSAKFPRPDLLLLDKQIAFAEYLNIRPIIIINKIDLENTNEIQKITKIYESLNYKVIKTSAIKMYGIEDIKKVLNGNISAFAGNSGVGKSSLINAILDMSIAEAKDISLKNKKGKNTTTFVKLYELEKNTYIADTPGFSTFDINEINSKDLDEYFIEFKENKKKCEFVDCTHIKEQKCGIKEALNENKISISRYNNFVSIYNNLKESEARKW